MTVVLIVFSGIIGAFTLIGIGANDVANSQGTAVGSHAISLFGAQIIAGIMEFAGSALVGGSVSNTVGNDIVDHTQTSDEEYCWGMLAALLSCGLWVYLYN